jgi:hypothetical protein
MLLSGYIFIKYGFLFTTALFSINPGTLTYSANFVYNICEWASTVLMISSFSETDNALNFDFVAMHTASALVGKKYLWELTFVTLTSIRMAGGAIYRPSRIAEDLRENQL